MSPVVFHVCLSAMQYAFLCTVHTHEGFVICAYIPAGDAAPPFCLGLNGEGGSAPVKGLFSLVISSPLSFSDKPSTVGMSPFTAACKKREKRKFGLKMTLC